ncbi:hypothetical protein IL306_013166 [Fusarium sp. DS 682]|nr:hypothetical protein IL306_013166 [Fusarium sp. DS 682]
MEGQEKIEDNKRPGEDLEGIKARLLSTSVRYASVLREWELWELRDLVRAWVKWKYQKTADQMEVEPIIREERKMFFEKVFDEWTSIKCRAKKPTAPTKDKFVSTIEVGKWKQDLPPSPTAQKRKQEEIGDSDRITKRAVEAGLGETTVEPISTVSKSKRTLSCQKGQPAYLTLAASIGNREPKVSFEWKDGSGQHAGDRYIQFSPDIGNHENAKFECLLNFDDS